MVSTILPVETDRLRLRAFQRDDHRALCQYYALPEVQRHLDWRARDEAETGAALEGLRRQVSVQRPGDCLTLAIERKVDMALVGHVSIRWSDATAGQGELRLVINPIHRRNGYGAEAARRAIDLGFDTLDLHRVFARCDARSQAPARLAKKLGMRLEAHYREHALFQGEWDEELHFAILDREWRHADDVRELRKTRVA